jgi:site-specific DNA-methyltransferase (adenine-specific)
MRCDGNGWTMHLGDSRDLVAAIGHVDAVVSDPPYGINWKPPENHQDQPWVDDEAFDPAPWLAIGQRHLFWGAQYFARRLPHSEAWLTWVKRPVAAGVDFSGDRRTYATTELAWSDWGKARFISHVWDGGKRAGAPDNRTFCHPAQKPIEVMEWCLRGLPETVRVILDPFAGSGTTGIACLRAGKRFVGIEREQVYFDLACERLRAEEEGSTLEARRVGQASLFGKAG